MSAPLLNKATFHNLNILRALSGLAVLFGHYVQIFLFPVFGRNFILNQFAALAEFAVITFFILSGFLIAVSIAKNLEKNVEFSARTYILARVSRIYPALVASIGCCYLIYIISQYLNFDMPNSLTFASDLFAPARTEFTFSVRQALDTFLQVYAFAPGQYLTLNGPLWSLSYEVGFYVFAGLAVKLVTGKLHHKLASLIMLVALFGSAYHYDKKQFFGFGLIWLLGAYIYKVHAYWNEEYTRPKAIALTVLAVALYSIGFIAAIFGNNLDLIRQLIFGLVVSGIIISIIITAKNFRWIKMSELSSSTYTLYLFHFPLMMFLYAIIRPTHDANPIAYFLLSAISFLTIPICAKMSIFLENRIFWEDTIRKLYHRIRKIFYKVNLKSNRSLSNRKIPFVSKN